MTSSRHRNETPGKAPRASLNDLGAPNPCDVTRCPFHFSAYSHCWFGKPVGLFRNLFSKPPERIPTRSFIYSPKPVFRPVWNFVKPIGQGEVTFARNGSRKRSESKIGFRSIWS